jgi:GSH-dependent disulfide-bond oxidoreductase
MAAFPWIVPYQRQGQRLEDFPKLKTGFDHYRPAVIKGLELGRQESTQTMSEEAKKVRFDQTSAQVLAR